jgi:N-acetylglutamate synthase-like GNAT family acetyltransferase
MTASPRIREASEKDATALVGRLEQLGYPSTASEIAFRLRAMTQFPMALAWVAKDPGIVGLATGHMLPSVHASAPVALLTTLVVDAEHRGRGVGRDR